MNASASDRRTRSSMNDARACSGSNTMLLNRGLVSTSMVPPCCERKQQARTGSSNHSHMNFDRGGGLVGSVFDSMGANALNANPAWWPSDKALPISAQSFDAFPMSSQCLRSASLPVGVVMASMSSHLLPNEAGIDLGDMIAVGGGSPTVEVAVKLSGSFGGPPRRSGRRAWPSLAISRFTFAAPRLDVAKLHARLSRVQRLHTLSS
mmetsp:Transcript_36241/g.95540  ORF Transcript_36241/g.95540 Transcript_36241/m.95540 type:complete len:207 (+) Transcript_36241:773-1393(+)